MIFRFLKICFIIYFYLKCCQTLIDVPVIVGFPFSSYCGNMSFIDKISLICYYKMYQNMLQETTIKTSLAKPNINDYASKHS